MREMVKLLPLDDQAALITYRREQNHHTVCMLNLSLEYSHIVRQWSVFDSYLIARLEPVSKLYITAWTHALPRKGDNLIVNNGRDSTEAHDAVNASGEPDFTQDIGIEAREDVSREKWLDDEGRPACHVILMTLSQFGVERFDVPSLQIAFGPIFLLRMSKDHIPRRAVNCLLIDHS
jgi:hypothetical protein